MTDFTQEAPGEILRVILEKTLVPKGRVRFRIGMQQMQSVYKNTRADVKVKLLQSLCKRVFTLMRVCKRWHALFYMDEAQWLNIVAYRIYSYIFPKPAIDTPYWWNKCLTKISNRLDGQVHARNILEKDPIISKFFGVQRETWESICLFIPEECDENSFPQIPAKTPRKVKRRVLPLNTQTIQQDVALSNVKKRLFEEISGDSSQPSTPPNKKPKHK